MTPGVPAGYSGNARRDTWNSANSSSACPNRSDRCRARTSRACSKELSARGRCVRVCQPSGLGPNRGRDLEPMAVCQVDPVLQDGPAPASVAVSHLVERQDPRRVVRAEDELAPFWVVVSHLAGLADQRRVVRVEAEPAPSWVVVSHLAGLADPPPAVPAR
jgi:hypothetical protein